MKNRQTKKSAIQRPGEEILSKQLASSKPRPETPKPEPRPGELRIAYFDATAELLLDQLRRISDLPAAARVLRVEADPPWLGRHERANIIRFYIDSQDLEAIPEGGIIPKLEPTARDQDARKIYFPIPTGRFKVGPDGISRHIYEQGETTAAELIQRVRKAEACLEAAEKEIEIRKGAQDCAAPLLEAASRWDGTIKNSRDLQAAALRFKAKMEAPR